MGILSNIVNEAEKRWKQTSMSPQEAIAKYGKENVKVKKGALRNGDDMVEVYVESMNEGGMSDIDAEAQEFVRGAIENAKYIQQDNYYFSDSTYYEFTDELDTDNEALMDHPLVQDTLRSLPHVDMDDEEIKQAVDALANMQMEEAETESYSPGDEMEDGMVSSCCGASIMDVYDGHGRCSDCKEMASAEKESEYYESKVMQAREQIAQEESPVSEFDNELQRIQDLVKFR